MKIKNKPSTEFFEAFYAFLKKELNTKFKSLDITINNIIADEQYVQEDFPVLGYIRCRTKKNKKVKYTIDFAELTSLNFKNREIYNLQIERYKEYLENLGFQICPESVSILTILHEFGHIDFIEKFKTFTETEDEANLFIAYSKAVEGLYEAIIKPWEFGSNVVLNVSNITFNPIEGYPELFSLRQFPGFIKFLKEYIEGYN